MRIIAALFCLLLVSPALAQDSVRRPLIYAGLKGQFGHLNGFKLSAAAIVGKRHELAAGYELYFQYGRNIPDDFLCWTCKHGIDKDWIGGLGLSYGYVIYPHFLKGFTRIVLRSGVLLGEQNIPYHFDRIITAPPASNNYTYTNDRHFAAAWLLNPSLDLAITRGAGLTLGSYFILNEDFAGGGVSFGVILGSVAKTKPPDGRRKETQVK